MPLKICPGDRQSLGVKDLLQLFLSSIVTAHICGIIGLPLEHTIPLGLCHPAHNGSIVRQMRSATPATGEKPHYLTT